MLANIGWMVAGAGIAVLVIAGVILWCWDSFLKMADTSPDDESVAP